MSDDTTAGAAVTGSLNNASVDRLACLLRHWTWADEALVRFDRELAEGWDDDADPMSDRPFGSLYHWCALLCAFADTALERGLMPPLQLAAIRQDLEVSLPRLQGCRRLLTAIPATMEEQPRIVELLRDDTLARLRRLHRAFGSALHQEQTTRELDSLDH